MTSSYENVILLISLGINYLVLSSVLIPVRDFRLGFLQCLLLNSVDICIFSSFLDRFQVFRKDVDQMFSGKGCPDAHRRSLDLGCDSIDKEHF